VHFADLRREVLSAGRQPAQPLSCVGFEDLDHFQYAILADHLAQFVEFSRVKRGGSRRRREISWIPASRGGNRA
jgi:hypothetical protein